jgi:uncharacterized protein (DUF58 family)
MSALPQTPDTVLRKLEWTVIRRLDGLLHGAYRTLFRGAGLDLADLREYQPHDDVRHIDWNVTARLQEPYVRQYTEDREVITWFLLDLSPSVDFGTGDSKRDLLIHFVTVLARVLTRHGNPVGAMFYRDGVEGFVLPRAGRRHVLHMLDRLLKYPALPESRATDLGAFLRHAIQIIRRRSLVFLVSDFISSPGWARPLAELARSHETIAIRISDPAEAELPNIGIAVMQDTETGERLFVDTHDAGFRRRFAAAAARREAAVIEALGTAGVDALELATGDDLMDSLLRFAALRKRRGRATAALPRQAERHLGFTP